MKTFVTLLLVSIIVLLAGCTVADPYTEDAYYYDLYTHNIAIGDLTTGYTLTINGIAIGGGGLEIDPVFTASPAFGITAGDINDWDDHPAYTTGIHGVGAGNVVGTTLVQELDNKTLDSSVGKGTWTASGTWKLPAMYFNGDITTDRWLSSETNTFLGRSVVGLGNLAHTAGSEGYYNTGFGYQAFNSITIGIGNTALGNASLPSLTDGSFNTAVGSGTLVDLVTGDYNTAIGVFAGHENLGDSNVFIGFSAGYNYAGNDALFIDNSDTATPLIYGDFSTNDLTIYGDLHLSTNSLDMTQIATEPSSTANRAGIYALDLAADECTIGFFTERAVEVALGVASTNRMGIRWNEETYYLLAEASGFYSALAGDKQPVTSDGLRIGTVWFDTNTDTWKKCTSLTPETWTPLAGGGGASWCSITGTLSAQLDLQGALDAKLSAITGTELDNVFSSTGLLKRTGAGTYTVDSNTYITGNQTITLGGILSGSGTTSITASAGTGYYMPFTSDQTTWNAKQTGHANLTSLAGLSYSSAAFVKMTNANTFTLDTSTYLTGNQTITLSGDASGSGTTSISVTNSGLKGVALPALATGYLYYSGSAWAFQTPAGGGESENVVVKSGDTANSTTTLANAVDLTFTADANSTYVVEVFLLWNSSATTVGIQVSATATNSPTIQAGQFITNAANGTPDSSSWNANDVKVTTSASAFTTYNSGHVTAILKTGGSTSVWTLRFAAETTGTITLKAGSTLRYRKVAP